MEEDRQRRGLDAAQKLAEAEAQRAEEGARSNRRLRWLVLLLAIFLVAAIAAAAFAVGESRRAETQARLAFARELTSSSTNTLGDDPELSMHLALQAILTTYDHDGTVLTEAEAALHRALQQNRVLHSLPQGGGLAFSPDGQSIATGGQDGSIVIWDVATGEEINTIHEHSSQVTSLDFNADGSLLASAEETFRRIVWDLESDRSILSLPASNGSGPIFGANKVAFSQAADILLTISPTNELEIWDVSTGYKLADVDDSVGPEATFSLDGRRLALITAVWDISSVPPRNAANVPHVLTWDDRQFDMAEAIVEIQAPSSSNLSVFQDTGSVAFNPDGSRLLTTSISNLAVLVDAHNGEALFSLRGHSGVIHNLAFSPDGSQVATGSADGTAQIWDAETGEVLLRLEGHQDEVIQVAFSPGGENLATSSLDGTTKLWDLTQHSRGEWPNEVAHSGEARVDFSGSEPIMVSGGDDGRLLLTQVETGETRLRLPGDGVGLSSAAISPDGNLLALGFESGKVSLLDSQTGQPRDSFEIDGLVSAFSFSPDGELLAAGSSDGTIWIWDTDLGGNYGAWDFSDGFINGLAFGPNGDRLAAASFTGVGWVVDVDKLLATGREDLVSLSRDSVAAELAGPTGLFVSLDWSPDGRRLVTGSWEGEVVVWDPETGEVEFSLGGHRGQVRDAVFSPDGNRIATAGSDGAVILWNTESGELLFPLDTLEGPLTSLAFSPDGKFLAVGSSDGSVQVYVLPIDELINLARSRLTRDLSDAECRRYLHLDECP